MYIFYIIECIVYIHIRHDDVPLFELCIIAHCGHAHVSRWGLCYCMQCSPKNDDEFGRFRDKLGYLHIDSYSVFLQLEGML